ncbi:MAG: hypothetical protein GQ574_13165 [Crocinitomix sp.]|nr:hypothetical protein [Crocinitomix sp.]
MSVKGYISKEKLPLGQNYQELRAIGMQFIQDHSGTTWTNLNPSDPGVTFLDELCFALTELGYCSNFPMEDLLTDSDENLVLDEQFYLPENILTTSAITLKDYRKYIIDRINVVENIDLRKTITNGKVVYTGYLKIASSIENVTIKLSEDPITETTEFKVICSDVKSALERCRNLGVHIAQPTILKRKFWHATGSISLNHKDDLVPFLNALIKASEAYIFPSVAPVPYSEIVAWEKNVNTIFNGPYLENGWISDEALGVKKDELHSFELVNVIRALAQVKGVNKLAFCTSKNDSSTDTPSTKDSQTKISAADTELIEIDWLKSISDSDLKIYANGQLIIITDEQMHLGVDSNPEPKPIYSEVFNSAASIQGNFRDVNTYYSIQETLPDVYAVGHNALQENDSDIIKAQSKQLKGYLTLFDQIMANQLSQLANLSTLFSFKNVTVGAPSDLQNYIFGKSKLEYLNPEFPAGYRVYAPTYFYQSLYKVPDVRPLLKGFDAFDFTQKFESKLKLENDSWKKFKLDPYNPYMKGLLDLTTNEDENLVRRNALLDHLLARHGESPQIIDQLIDGSTYAGSQLKDQVVFKSLLLQNYGTLSYNRVRSYAVPFADELAVRYESIVIPIRTYHKESENFDFILDAGRINETERISIDDCRNSATIELKLSLLLGLKPLYKEYLLDWFGKNKTSEEIVAISQPKPGTTQVSNTNVETYIETNPYNLPQPITQINWLLIEKKGLLFFESSYLALGESVIPLEDLVFILPAFATTDILPNFNARIELCLAESLPVDLTYQVKYANQDELQAILKAYMPWFNMQLFQKLSSFDQDDFETVSMSLYNAVNAITTKEVAPNE